MRDDVVCKAIYLLPQLGALLARATLRIFDLNLARRDLLVHVFAILLHLVFDLNQRYLVGLVAHLHVHVVHYLLHLIVVKPVLLDAPEAILHLGSALDNEVVDDASVDEGLGERFEMLELLFGS